MLVIAALAAGYAYRRSIERSVELAAQISVAEKLFYSMKALDVHFAAPERSAEGTSVQDAEDDRLKWDRATSATARYIKDLYVTDAQASGLLVMAAYSWGESRVLELIRSLTPNPKERNFWTLLQRYRARIPPETYDYVFSIVAAAVIGENPRLFGFPFDSPPASLESEQPAPTSATGRWPPAGSP